MDKSVLLVLFSLQVLLLITAFTSTDAATLVRDDQRLQSPILEVSEPDKGKGGRKVKRQAGCWFRPGSCSPIGWVPATKRQSADLVELLKKKKLQPVLQN